MGLDLDMPHACAEWPTRLRAGTARPRLHLLWLTLAALLWSLTVAAAETAPNREALIKAAILYNFARFTEWPQPALAGQAEFRLCVLSSDSFAAALASIERKPLHGRPVTVVPLDGPEQIDGCNLLYLGTDEATRAAAVLDVVGRAPILLVAEIPLFNRGGGHIEMQTVDDRVRFGINQAGAERVGLKFSAKLLNLSDPRIESVQGTRDAPVR